MSGKLGLVIVMALAIASIGEASIFRPISDAHRSAAEELFTLSDGSFGSLEETYEALRTFEVLGIEKKSVIRASTCKSIGDVLSASSSSHLKDLFQALRVNGILKCELNDDAIAHTASTLTKAVNNAKSLLDFYYSIGGLVLIKDQNPEVEVHLKDAKQLFHSIKALSQSDGRWRYISNNPDASSYAAGMALKTLAGVISLASSEIEHSLIDMLKNDISKLFDHIEKYDDGAYYFDEKLDVYRHNGPLSASSSIVHGITALATATHESLNIPGEKILGLAKFFLGIGIPGNEKDLFYQIDALACLEDNRVYIPLILSLPTTVLSLTSKDQLKVHVNTALGSSAPPLSVRFKQFLVSGSRDASLVDQDLKFDSENDVHILDALPESIDVGSYIFSFDIVLHDPEHKKIYATGGRSKVTLYVTGVIAADHAEIAILDSDLENVETKKMLNFAGENSASLQANHLQKLRLAFQLTTPLGHAFKPHQAFLKLRHESSVEHIFVVGSSGKQFEIILDFLGLVEKLFYLSGRYDIQLTVGDAVMENSFLQSLGYVELDLPEAPEKAARPLQPIDSSTNYGPKAEISHIFRVPEKQPPRELSLAFLALVLLPFFGFLIGLLRLRVNLKNFPSAPVPAMFAALFHVGIAAVLALYLLFWLKLNLFTTLKALGVLGIFLMFVGHSTLSHLASTSAKLKSA
ncbi:hypothetical protein DM860_011971 [Cuscuta australis]|uniref:Dolichyl-diphosphooligosaccharide--protein glycosyltransferase subunit 2 n=1 Tax=Cuscuta australis TaxID=267555 RepID=A0A328DCE7_9ASTE|nr:hypothetical protein DM860_011971 [Cuscuta australis]